MHEKGGPGGGGAGRAPGERLVLPAFPFSGAGVPGPCVLRARVSVNGTSDSRPRRVPVTTAVLSFSHEGRNRVGTPKSGDWSGDGCRRVPGAAVRVSGAPTSSRHQELVLLSLHPCRRSRWLPAVWVAEDAPPTLIVGEPGRCHAAVTACRAVGLGRLRLATQKGPRLRVWLLSCRPQHRHSRPATVPRPLTADGSWDRRAQSHARSQPSRGHGEGHLPRTVSQPSPRQTRWP